MQAPVRQSRAARFLPLLPILLVALVLRIALWDALPRTGLISDEGEYLSAAHWLAGGRDFSWYQSYLWTRAPLYPLFVAAHLRLFGDALEPIFISQTLLSLLAIVLVYLLAQRLTSEPQHEDSAAIPSIAAFFTAIFLPFASYSQILLSETLYITLLLAGFLALAYLPPAPARRTPVVLVLAGAIFGLATLTRSLTLLFIPLVAVWLLLQSRRTPENMVRRIIRASWAPVLWFGLTALLVIGPWTLYNSRMYGGLVLVDTSGAFNLLLGGRTAYDGKREDAVTRDFVLGLLGQKQSEAPSTCRPFPGALPSQAARQAAMTSEGLCLIGARPAAFVQKSLAELVDLFQINYTGAERFTGGFSTGRLPPWYVLSLFLLDDTLYVLVLPLAVLGWAIARRQTLATPRASLLTLIGLWWLYNLAAAPLLFAINRFRLPLMPFAFILAAWALVAFARRIQQSTSHAPAGSRRYTALCGILAGLLFLIAATPYAYLEPRAPGSDSRWASYLGPYPSSLEITKIALAARPAYEANLRFAEALQSGQFEAANTLLQSGMLSGDMGRLGPALLAAHQQQLEEGLAALPPPETITRTRDTLASVVRGDLLRTQGDFEAARAAFTPEFVDSANPVEWAWEFLTPAPTRRIDLGGNLDLGYVNSCYLGEGDQTLAPPATFRWCSNGTQLRFPKAARAVPQLLVFRSDGRGWRGYAAQAPVVEVFAGTQHIGSFQPNIDGVSEQHVTLPAGVDGADLVITLRTPTFVPDAAHYLGQQSAAVVGQVQRLGLRLDWVEVREAGP